MVFLGSSQVGVFKTGPGPHLMTSMGFSQDGQFFAGNYYKLNISTPRVAGFKHLLILSTIRKEPYLG